MIIFWILAIAVLLAPMIPFVMLIWIARKRPDLWKAYWRSPVLNAFLLSPALAAFRVAVLLVIYVLSRINSLASAFSVYAWFPETLARQRLACLTSFGWNVLPYSNEAPFATYEIIFILNLAFWLVLLLLAALATTIQWLGKAVRHP